MHTRISNLLEASSVPYRVIRHADFQVPITNAADFAAVLGFVADRVTKTLLVRDILEPKYSLIVLSSPRRLNMQLAASLMGLGRIKMASREELDNLLQYPPNGVSPIGGGVIPVLMDQWLLQFPTILIGAGTQAVEIEIKPQDLVSICGAKVAVVSALAVGP